MNFLFRLCLAKFFLLACLLASASVPVRAEVISVAQIDTGFFINSAPTQTLYWQGKAAKALLVFIPGGEGYIGLKPGQTDHRYQFYQMLKRLTNPAFTSGKFDVVLLDSPAELSPRQPYPTARAGSDHMVRIESVVRFYKEKTALPVWLMGHSNGGISLTEFVLYLQKGDKMSLIAGIIPSGARSETYFKPPMNLPVLVLHHQQDACSHTLPKSAAENFAQVKAFNTASTELVWLTSGEAEPRDPCRSGFHMYRGASDESAKVIDVFMSKFYN
ncbi:MAG: hypothetical protein RLZZ296_968 [Pseudomonadota bacterium]|jgi:hypothetical protein